MIIINGEIVAQASQFGTKDVETITATVDLEEVRAFRFAPSRNQQAVSAPSYRRIETSFRLSKPDSELSVYAPLSPKIQPKLYKPEEEIAYGPGSWLWYDVQLGSLLRTVAHYFLFQ